MQWFFRNARAGLWQSGLYFILISFWSDLSAAILLKLVSLRSPLAILTNSNGLAYIVSLHHLSTLFDTAEHIPPVFVFFFNQSITEHLLSVQPLLKFTRNRNINKHTRTWQRGIRQGLHQFYSGQNLWYKRIWMLQHHICLWASRRCHRRCRVWDNNNVSLHRNLMH